jgi:hypothetical protein
MCRIDATLHSQNTGSNTFSRRYKVEYHTSATNRGGGRNPLGPFNGQWTSTIDVSTHRRSSFIHQPGTVTSATIIWNNQSINRPIRVTSVGEGATSVGAHIYSGFSCAAYILHVPGVFHVLPTFYIDRHSSWYM